MLRDRLGFDFFPIGSSKNFEREVDLIYEASLIDLLRAHIRISTKEEFSPYDLGNIDVVSIEEAINNLKTYLNLRINWITLEEVIRESKLGLKKNRKSSLASTFSASLELAKRGEIVLEQSNLFDNIRLKLKE